MAHSPTESILLVSGLGDDTGGGLFTFDGQAVSRIDRLSSTGLAVTADRFVRLLWSPDEASALGEMLVYDQRGVLRYLRVDGLREPHGVLWDGEHFVAVSTGTNELLWISPDGGINRRWRAPGEDDSWHLNSVLLHNAELVVSAFGRQTGRRAWSADLRQPAGVLINVRTGQEMLNGLICPHNPIIVEHNWLMCWSSTHELVEIDAGTGQVRRSLGLDGWTRGLAVSDDLIFVGESANRADPAAAETASIAIVSRSLWTVLDRVRLPCREVYDLVFAAPSLVEAARCGFRTNPHRQAESDQFALFDEVGVRSPRLWALGEPLPVVARRADISAALPQTLTVDTRVEIECSIRNLGSAILVSAPPNPVQIAYRWLDPDAGRTIMSAEPLRSRLPRALTPGDSVVCRMRVQTPPVSGVFLLRLTLVQEYVAWFDETDGANVCEGLVRILPSAPP